MKTLQEAIQDDDEKAFVDVLNLVGREYLNRVDILKTIIEIGKINIYKVFIEKCGGGHVYLRYDKLIQTSFDMFKYIIYSNNSFFKDNFKEVILYLKDKDFKKYTYLLSVKEGLMSDYKGKVKISFDKV